MRFLGRNMSQISPSAQPMDTASSYSLPHPGAGERNMVLNGLRFELDSYLHELQMDQFKTTTQGSESDIIVGWCDPLLYWMVCVLPYFSVFFSAVRIGHRKEVPVSLSTRDGYPPGTSICGCLRVTLFFKQRDMHPPPESN